MKEKVSVTIQSVRCSCGKLEFFGREACSECRQSLPRAKVTIRTKAAIRTGAKGEEPCK